MDDFYGFKKEEFLFNSKKSILVFPEKADKNRNWILKTEYWGAFPNMELEFLKKGFHLAYLENNNRFATPEDCDAKQQFVEFLNKEYNLSNKCVPLGMSLGGAHAVNFAGFYPQSVSCVILDAPVLNFLSYPGSETVPDDVWNEEFVKAYPRITRAKLLNNFKYHPINQAQKMIENNIPVVMIYGTEDQTVRYSENGKLLEEMYSEKKNLLKIIKRIMQGHHPHGDIQDMNQIFDFVFEYTKKGL